jgi:hypothetical protein
VSHWHKLIGFEDGLLDRILAAHRSRLLDRAGVVVAVLGFALVLIAVIGGDVGKLHGGDWIAAGSVFVGAGGLFLSFGRGS